MGDPYLRAAVDDDVRNLYATGFFYNIQVTADDTPDGVVLTYKVQGKPRLTEIKFQGNTKFKDAKLLKKISSKAGEPLDERKLFTDTQDIQKLYQKKGYPRTQVKYVLNIDETGGPRHRHVPDHRESQGQDPRGGLRRRQAHSRKRSSARPSRPASIGCFPGSPAAGYLKDEQFDEDKEKLTELLSRQRLH